MRNALAAAVLAAVVTSSSACAEKSPALRIAGPKQVVFDWSRQACTPDEIPDTPARAFRDAAGRVQLLIAHHATRRLVGPSLGRLRSDCRVVFRSEENPRPAAYADREWLASPYALDGGRTVVALVHNEYQGNTHLGRCPSASYRRCWYNAITLAVSHDGGLTYRHPPPPRQLVAALPYRYVPDRGPVGVFEPSNIVRDPNDGFLYALVQIFGPRRRPAGTCVMRTARPLVASSWRAWDGEGFDLRFVDPYRTHSTRRGAVCKIVSPREIVDMNESVTFNTALERFVLLGVATARDPRTGARVTGVYYSFSRDLVTWTRRRLLLAAPLPWAARCRGPRPLAYPSALDPTSRSRNFDVTGARFYLYVTRFNGGCARTLDRDLVRYPVEVTPG